jgi:shikimate 5-dehydrogenase
VGEGELVDLLLDRLDHRRVAVAQAGNGGAARGIEVALADAVDQVTAFASGGGR